MRIRPDPVRFFRNRRIPLVRRSAEFAMRLDRRKEEDDAHHDGPERYALKR